MRPLIDDDGDDIDETFLLDLDFVLDLEEECKKMDLFFLLLLPTPVIRVPTALTFLTLSLPVPPPLPKI